MKPSSCKAKGRQLQNAVAGLVREWFGLNPDDCRPAIMGETGADLKLSSAAKRVFPFAIECKRQESLNIWQALKQAEENAAVEGLHPALVFQRNRSKAYAVVPLATWLEMAAAYTREEGTEVRF